MDSSAYSIFNFLSVLNKSMTTDIINNYNQTVIYYTFKTILTIWSFAEIWLKEFNLFQLGHN